MQKINFSIIVLWHNVGIEAKEVINSLVNATTGLDAKIIFIDDCSSDTSGQFLKKSIPLFDNAVIYRCPINFGKFSLLPQILIADSMVEGEFWCIQDGDELAVRERFVDAMKVFGSDESVGAMAHRKYSSNGNPIHKSWPKKLNLQRLIISGNIVGSCLSVRSIYPIRTLISPRIRYKQDELIIFRLLQRTKFKVRNLKGSVKIGSNISTSLVFSKHVYYDNLIQILIQIRTEGIATLPFFILRVVKSILRKILIRFKK